MAIDWYEDLDAAMVAAREQRRPLLIDFWKPG